MSNILNRLLGYIGEKGQVINGFLSHQNSNYEWLIIVGFILAIFIIGFTLGRSRIIIVLLNIYITQFFVLSFPFFEYLATKTGLSSANAHLTFFIIVYVSLFFALSKIMHGSRLSIKEVSLKVVLPVIFITAAFLLSIFIVYIPKDTLNTIELLRPYFETKAASLLWSIAPIVVLLLFKVKTRSLRT